MARSGVDDDLRYVVRHAKAGRRQEWTGDDRLRPLSKTGWKQARGVAARLAGVTTGPLVASPYVRCVQTLEPLATSVGTTVRPDERLAEGAPFEEALAVLTEGGPGVVLCSHGDVIPELLQALVRRGAALTTAPDWRKASVWVLRIEDEVVVSAAAEAPPER